MTAACFWLGFYTAVLICLGYAAVALIYAGRRLDLAEACGLTLCLGTGNLSLLLFLSSLFGHPPSRMVLVAGLLIALFLLAALAWRRLLPGLSLPPAGGSVPRPLWAVIAGGLFLLYLIAAVGIDSLFFPLYDWDGFAIWGLKARVLFTTSLRERPEYFFQAPLSFSHQDYPLLVPFLTAGVYGAVGQVNDQLGKMPQLLLYVALACTLYHALRWKLPRGAAAILALIGISVPVLIRWAGAGNADLALTTYYGASVYYLVRGRWEEDCRALVLAGLLTGFMAFTKNEGLALAAINLLVLALFSLRRPGGAPGRMLVLFFLAAALVLAPWLWWSLDLPRTHEDYASRLTIAGILDNLDRLGTIFSEFGRQIVAWERWGFLWGLLFSSALLGYRGLKRPHVQAVWLLFGAHIALYVLVYLVTPWDLGELFAISLDRLLLHTVPAAVLLAGLHIAEFLPGPSSTAGSLSHEAPSASNGISPA